MIQPVTTAEPLSPRVSFLIYAGAAALAVAFAFSSCGCAQIPVARTYSIEGSTAGGDSIRASVRLEPPAKGLAK